MKKYYCNCEKYCQGDQKEVSKTTFFNHKKYRDLFTPQFQDYLNRCPVVVSEPGRSRHLTGSFEVVVDRDVVTHFTGILDLADNDMLGFYIYRWPFSRHSGRQHGQHPLRS
jgi:hypothetical protein